MMHMSQITVDTFDIVFVSWSETVTIILFTFYCLSVCIVCLYIQINVSIVRYVCYTAYSVWI